MFKYVVYKIGYFLANVLSLKAAYGVAIFISDLHYLFSFRDRRAVKDNLRVICPDEKKIAPFARTVFRNFGKYLVEFFRIAKHLDQTFIDQKINIVNRHYLDNVLAQGKGAITLTAHIGNWELGATIISVLGYPIGAIALPHKERPVNDLFNHQRQVKGVKIIPSNIAIRRCLEAFKNNHIIAIAADRDFTANGEIIDFLGKKTLIPKGAAVFTRKMNAPIVPVFLIRHEDNSFTLTFKEPLYADQSLGEEESILQLMKTYAAIIEKEIRATPTQWLMFRKFWIE
ncbi:MAG: lysophospholipid acyltransferase family protein [Candidatus Omnitrophota bacterium]